MSLQCSLPPTEETELWWFWLTMKFLICQNHWKPTYDNIFCHQICLLFETVLLGNFFSLPPHPFYMNAWPFTKLDYLINNRQVNLREEVVICFILYMTHAFDLILWYYTPTFVLKNPNELFAIRKDMFAYSKNMPTARERLVTRLKWMPTTGKAGSSFTLTSAFTISIKLLFKQN